MSRLAAIAAFLSLALPAASAAENGEVEDIIRNGIDQIVDRLPHDPLVIDQCTRLGADAVRTYRRFTSEGRRAEAMTAISEELQPELVRSGLYVCGLYALSNTLRLSPEELEADEMRLPVAVAMNWASANAVPFGEDVTGPVYFASAAASTFYGLPPSSTEPVFCIAARHDLPEAVDVLRAWPTPSDCVKPVADAPERGAPEAAPEPQPVIIASVQTGLAEDEIPEASGRPETAEEPVPAPVGLEPGGGEETVPEPETARETQTEPEPELEPEPETEPLFSTEDLNRAALSGQEVTALAAARAPSPKPLAAVAADGMGTEEGIATEGTGASVSEEPIGEPDVDGVEGLPEGAPPPAPASAYGDPPAQRSPMQVAAPRDGLSGCQAFFRNYWTEERNIVQIRDTFCRTDDGDYIQVSTDFRIIE